MSYDKPLYDPHMYEKDDYMKVHIISSNKFWHIYWNLFRKGYKSYKLIYFITDYNYEFGICFGIGEICISIRKHK